MTKVHVEITEKMVREALEYDPMTGDFRWRQRRTAHVKAGDLAGSINAQGYLCIKFIGRQTSAHRLAWLYMTGMWPKGQIDHINGDRVDNRFVNLRDVPKAVNLQNQRRAHVHSTHGFLGVRVEKRWSRPRYRALITVNGVRSSLGGFDTPEEAHDAYLAAKRVLHKGCTI